MYRLLAEAVLQTLLLEHINTCTLKIMRIVYITYWSISCEIDQLSIILLIVHSFSSNIIIFMLMTLHCQIMPGPCLHFFFQIRMPKY